MQCIIYYHRSITYLFITRYHLLPQIYHMFIYYHILFIITDLPYIFYFHILVRTTDLPHIHLLPYDPVAVKVDCFILSFGLVGPRNLQLTEMGVKLESSSKCTSDQHRKITCKQNRFMSRHRFDWRNENTMELGIRLR